MIPFIWKISYLSSPIVNETVTALLLAIMFLPMWTLQCQKLFPVRSQNQPGPMHAGSPSWPLHHICPVSVGTKTSSKCSVIILGSASPLYPSLGYYLIQIQTWSWWEQCPLKEQFLCEFFIIVSIFLPSSYQSHEHWHKPPGPRHHQWQCCETEKQYQVVWVGYPCDFKM